MNNRVYGRLASRYFINATTCIEEEDTNTLHDLYKVNTSTKIQGTNLRIVNHDVKPLETAKKIPELAIQYSAANKRRIRTIDSAQVNVAIAAFITAHGRVQLYNAIN